MSIRAYRINKIEYEKDETFNLWHNDILIDFFNKECNFCETLNDGSGITEIPVETLKKALKLKGIKKYIKDSLKKDIEWAKKWSEAYVQYYCL